MAEDWQEFSLCALLVREGLAHPDLWFQPEESTESALAADTCFSCPVRQECLSWSKRTKQEYGILGGFPASVRTSCGVRSLAKKDNPYDVADPDHRLHRSRLVDTDSMEAVEDE